MTCAHLQESITLLLQGRTTFHSFSPGGRRWDEGAPAARYGIIVTPSPHPLPTRSRVYPTSSPRVRKSGKPDFVTKSAQVGQARLRHQECASRASPTCDGEGVKRRAHLRLLHLVDADAAVGANRIPRCQR